MAYPVKRCPFCNDHPDVFETTQVSFAVKCFNCGAIGPQASTRVSAVDLWNGRHKHTNPSALVANRKSNHHEMKEVDLCQD